MIRKGDATPAILARGLKSPTSIAPTPDGLWFAAIESAAHSGKNYKIQNEPGFAGALAYPQNLYWFHVPDTADNLGGGACVFDRDGRLYVATRLGIAALDRNGRTRLIIPMPAPGNAEATEVCLGGGSFDTLHAICGNVIYKRKLRITGAPAWLAPITLPRWGAGC